MMTLLQSDMANTICDYANLFSLRHLYFLVTEYISFIYYTVLEFVGYIKKILKPSECFSICLCAYAKNLFSLQPFFVYPKPDENNRSPVNYSVRCIKHAANLQLINTNTTEKSDVQK